MLRNFQKIRRRKSDYVEFVLRERGSILFMQHSNPFAGKMKGGSNYIILPGQMHGFSPEERGDAWSYGDLLVSAKRVQVAEAESVIKNTPLEETVSKLRENGYNLNERGFCGYLKWTESHVLLDLLGSFMLNLRQEIDLVKYLKSGKVYDGNGRKISDGKRKAILHDVLTSGNKEWVDVRCTKDDRERLIYNSMHIVEKMYDSAQAIHLNGLRCGLSVPLEKCLTDLQIKRVNLNYWLAHATTHGFPPENTPKGRFPYVSPAYSAQCVFPAELSPHFLGFHPVFSSYAIGVRAAKARNQRE